MSDRRRTFRQYMANDLGILSQADWSVNGAAVGKLAVYQRVICFFNAVFQLEHGEFILANHH